jgi:signal transduction histidine kinase
VRFDETTEVTAYLCVLEALTNAAKYAPGTQSRFLSALTVPTCR